MSLQFKVASSLVNKAHFKPQKVENTTNVPSKGSIRRLMYMSFSVNAFVIASTMHVEFPFIKGPQSSLYFVFYGPF